MPPGCDAAPSCTFQHLRANGTAPKQRPGGFLEQPHIPRVLGRCLERRILPWRAWAPDGHLAVCYLPTQGLLQEIPALQHFLHTPRGCETWPDVVFLTCPASAAVAQHRDNRRSGAQLPSATPDRKMQWEKREPEPNRACWPLISTEQTCPTGEAHTCQKGIAGFAPRHSKVKYQGSATKTQLQTLPETPWTMESVSPNLTSRV